MSIVYIVQNQHHLVGATLKPKFDFTSAEKYGELVMLLSPGARPFEPAHVISELREKLSSYTSRDYLLLVGNPCLIGFATAIAADVNNGFVRMLQWNGKKKKYVEICAQLHNED